MAKQNDPLVIPYFATGLYTHRSQLFSPYRSVGINVVSYHDAVIDGQDMELTTLLQWRRRPGFSRFCSQQLGGLEIPLQFYSARQPAGTVVSFMDSNVRWATFSTSAITTLLAKSTAAQGYIQQVGGTTYYTDGADQVKWDGSAVTGWGVIGPQVTPAITSTGSGQFWQSGFTPPANYIILDPNGNFQKAIVTGLTGSSAPIWNTTYNGSTLDNLAVWSMRGAYGGWTASNPYVLGTIIVDSSGNLQEVTTAGTSGATVPGWATTIGATTTDSSVTWTMRGVGFANPVVNVGPDYPGTVAQSGTGTAWSNPSNIELADTKSAQIVFFATGSSQTLFASNFGFSLPPAAVISGIKVEVGAFSSGNANVRILAQLVKSGIASGNIKVQGIGSNNPLTTYSLGGSSDVWGTTFLGVDVNSATFGVNISAATTIVPGFGFSENAGIDFVRVTVFYSGTAGTLGTGQLSAQAGYSYVACYHLTSGHVSTASPPTSLTGPILGQFANTLTIPASPRPDCDVVQFYRTADGGGLYYLLASTPNPGSGTVTYLDNGSPDANLNSSIIAPLNHLNDAPPTGGSILCYWQGRVWMAVGNLLRFNAGPDCINGVPEESWPPANVFQYSGPIIGLTRTSQGLLVWGSDYVAMALGGPQTLSFYPYDLLQNFGISSPNCIDQDGDEIAILSTAGQCWQLNMSGKSETGNYVTELLVANFTPTNSFVTYHRQGQDSGLWLSDGSVNALRYSLNVGSWSTQYKPVGGISALNSIETSPGQMSLCMGRSTGGGYILARNQSVWQDDGQNYTNCFITVGSIVLTQPGSTLAPLQHVVLYCDAAGTGVSGPTVPAVAILPNEVAASPPASFLTLANPVSEYTTGNNQSYSLLSMRWPVDSINSLLSSQLMHHVQVRITFPPENAPNSIKALALMFNKNG